MAKKSERRTIGNTIYVVTQLGGLAGRSAVFHLIKLFGPTIGKIIGAGGISSIATLDVSAAIEAFASTAQESDFTKLCDMFAACTQVVMPTQGNTPAEILMPLDFDSQFAGCDPDMLAWLGFAATVNCASFFAGAGVKPIAKTPGPEQSS